MASKKKRNRPRPAPAKAAAPAAKAGGARPRSPAPSNKPAAAKTAARPAGEKTGPTRSQRLAAAEAARRRKAARNRGLVIGGIVAVLVLLTVTVANSRRSNDRVVSKLEASGACKYDTKSDTDNGPGNNHVNGDIQYQVDPPAGGNHNPTASQPGVYTATDKPPDAQIVHALEHGYVAIWYKSGVDAGQVDQLRTLANKYDRDVLLIPRDSMSPPVAATAWHRRLLCSRTDTAALEQFVTAYRNKGPENVPH